MVANLTQPAVALLEVSIHGTLNRLVQVYHNVDQRLGRPVLGPTPSERSMARISKPDPLNAHGSTEH